MDSIAPEGTSTAEYRFDEETADALPSPAEVHRAGEVVSGRYRLVRTLGVGSSAQVWTAHDDRLDRDVAIKLLRTTGARGVAERERLRREAHALAHLNHPRITAVFDLVDAADPSGEHALALVTELLTGEDLAARLARGPLGLEQTLELCSQVADALDAAHRAGVVHRDVKPANVMLTPAGVKLLDFGIARLDAESELTGPTAIGTPACMAPEQWLGKPAEPATDVYALGCLLYWCLAGRAPFAERVLPALAMAHLGSEPPALPDRGQGPRIDRLYRACLAKDPRDRPSAAFLAVALDPAARAVAAAPAVRAWPLAGWRRVSARSWATVILTSVVLSLASTLAIVLSTAAPAAPPAGGTVAHSAPRQTPSGSPSPSRATVLPAAGRAAQTGPSAGSAQASASQSTQKTRSKPVHRPPGHGHK
jgi:serine/threonine-protein kinase